MASIMNMMFLMMMMMMTFSDTAKKIIMMDDTVCMVCSDKNLKNSIPDLPV